MRRIPAFGGTDILHATYTRHSFSPHFHETFAIGVITRGACAMACRGTTYLLRPGHVVVIAPGEVHTGERVGDEGWSYRMIYPSVSALGAATGIEAEPMLVGEQRGFCSPVVNDRHLAGAYLTLHRALSLATCPMEQETLAADLLRSVLATQSLLPLAEPRPSHRALRVARDYMHAHCAEALTLDAIAREAGLSYFYVVRAFRAAFGIPPHAYLAVLRLERARALLRAGMPIAQAALDAGFADQSHLTRFFKRVFGMTPGVYARATRSR